MKVLDLNGLKKYNEKLLNKIKSMLSAYIPLSGSTEITGKLRSYDEIQSTAPNAFRLAHPKCGTILRNDGDKTYFLLTNENDTYGSWNNLRPLSIVNSTGVVQCENGIEGNLNGHATSSTNAEKTNSISSTGFGDTALTYYQSGDSFYDYNGWCHYLIANHGGGEHYYNYTIGLPFWGSPIYKRQEGTRENTSGWQKFYTTENITYGTSGLTVGSSNLEAGSIYFQYE